LLQNKYEIKSNNLLFEILPEISTKVNAFHYSFRNESAIIVTKIINSHIFGGLIYNEKT